MSYILNNRFYIGELRRGGAYYQARHQPLIDRTTFLSCQDVLNGENGRATPQVNMPLSSGLLICRHCGSFITGERIKRKLKGGGVRVHDYYRCANTYPDDDHPSVRWRADDLEDAIVADLASFRLPDDEVIDWFRVSLQNAFTEITDLQRNQRSAQTKRRAELITMNDRLLNAFLAGSIDEATLNAKQAALRDEAAQIEETPRVRHYARTGGRPGRPGGLRVLAESPRNLARFKDARKTADPRNAIFEPHTR